MLVAGTGVAPGPILASTEGPPATTIGDPAELLVVLVDEGPGMAGDVANWCRGHPIGVAKAAQAVPAEGSMHGRRGQSEEWPEAVRAISPAGPGGDELSLALGAQPLR